MLYDLIRDLKTDMDRRFNEIDKKFEDANNKMEKLEVKIDKNTEQITHLTERVDYLFLNREKIKISFSKTFAFGTALFSAFVSYVLVLFGID